MKSLCRVWLICFVAFMVVLRLTLPNVFLLAFWYMPVTMAVTFCVVAFFRFILSSGSDHRPQPSP